MTVLDSNLPPKDYRDVAEGLAYMKKKGVSNQRGVVSLTTRAYSLIQKGKIWGRFFLDGRSEVN